MDSEFVSRADVVGCRCSLFIEISKVAKLFWLYIGGSKPDLQVGFVYWCDFNLPTAELLFAGLLPFDGVAGANYIVSNKLLAVSAWKSFRAYPRSTRHLWRGFD